MTPLPATAAGAPPAPPPPPSRLVSLSADARRSQLYAAPPKLRVQMDRLLATYLDAWRDHTRASVARKSEAARKVQASRGETETAQNDINPQANPRAADPRQPVDGVRRHAHHPLRCPSAQAQYRGNCGRAIAERKGALRQMHLEGDPLCASLPPSPEIGVVGRRRASGPSTATRRGLSSARQAGVVRANGGSRLETHSGAARQAIAIRRKCS